MEQVGEVATATGEVAKAISPLIDNLAKLTGPLCEEVGEYFGDKVRAYRQRNLGKIIEGSLAKLEAAAKPINPIPPRLLLPMVESASLEDNETLQDMWSGLLATASDRADDMSPAFTETLRVLTPLQAKVLDKLYVSGLAQLNNNGSFGSVFDLEFFLQLHAGTRLLDIPSVLPDKPTGRRVLEYLTRLGLLRLDYDLRYVPTMRAVIGLFDEPKSTTTETQSLLSYDLHYTQYAIDFMEACQGPSRRTSWKARFLKDMERTTSDINE